jgi:hypothetical protein
VQESDEFNAALAALQFFSKARRLQGPQGIANRGGATMLNKRRTEPRDQIRAQPGWYPAAPM